MSLGQVHAKWTFVTKSRCLCSLSVKVGKKLQPYPLFPYLNIFSLSTSYICIDITWNQGKAWPGIAGNKIYWKTDVAWTGAHFKKWCFMQSKIKSGTVLEVKFCSFHRSTWYCAPITPYNFCREDVCLVLLMRPSVILNVLNMSKWDSIANSHILLKYAFCSNLFP